MNEPKNQAQNTCYDPIELQLKAIQDALGYNAEQMVRAYAIEHKQVLCDEPHTETRIVRKRAAHGKPARSQVGYTIKKY